MVDYVNMTIKKQKNIALIAHDGKKDDMIKWCKANKEVLSKHKLSGTGTTARMIADHVGLEIRGYNSGPLGGDQQIGAMIAERKIDMLIFFCDNLIVQGHQNDVSALSRLASLYNIAFATNRTTADLLLTSPLLDDPDYQIQIPDCIANYANRKLTEDKY